MITFITGLPASGKTHYAQTLGIAVLDEPSTPQEITLFAKNHGNIAVIDPALCIWHFQVAARDQFPNSTWIYFANDPIQCTINAKRRIKNVTSSIYVLSRLYVIPPQAQVVPVWRDCNDFV